MKKILTKVKNFLKNFADTESTEKELKFQVNKIDDEDVSIDTELKKAGVLVVLILIVSIFVQTPTSGNSNSRKDVTLPSPNSVTLLTTTACITETENDITTSVTTITSETSCTETTAVTTTTEETVKESPLIVQVEADSVVFHEDFYEIPSATEEEINEFKEPFVVESSPVTEVTTVTETEPVVEETQKQDMTYLGNLKITGYVATGNPTASGQYPYVGGVAMSRSYGLPWGTTIYIDGLGYYTVNDCGCSYGVVDIFCNSISECYDLTSYHDVYIVN